MLFLLIITFTFYLSYKIFYDFEVSVHDANLFYAPCYNSTFLDILETITHRFVPGFLDPETKEIQFWDTLRYLLHGKLRCDVNDINIQLLTTKSPQRGSKVADTVTLTLDVANIEIDPFKTEIKANKVEINLPDRLCKTKIFDEMKQMKQQHNSDQIQKPLIYIPGLVIFLRLTWSAAGDFALSNPDIADDYDSGDGMYDHWIYPFKSSSSVNSSNYVSPFHRSNFNETYV